jgi:hypothetical protein
VSKFGAIRGASKARSEKKEVKPASTGAKRNDPDFKQISAYLRVESHDEAAIKLRRENRSKEKSEQRDFSELLEDLLSSWVGE